VYRAVTTYRPSPAAKKWYDEGVAALRDGTYLKAANSLAEAVKSDPRYALAHARLADAWAELDSTGQAQQEMLLATDAEQKTSLPQEDKQYVDAVQATLIRNYSAAAQDYEDILKNLPADRRADGLVDLGRAYEKAGKIKETITQYEQAAKENPDDPAPFVHIGIWKSRQRDPVGAEKAFTQAEKIYTAKSNQEGLAEVDYQRGYAANGAGDPERALVYLGKSLATARQISSPQLEARTLTQLSSIEYNGGKEDKGIEDASRAIKIASDNNLEYWYDDGEMRLGNAYLHKGDLKNAESYTQDALRLARQNRHPRLEADAMYTLASIRYQQGKWDEEIALARAALKYFEDFGFAEMAASASTLIVMGELGEGNLSAARKDSVELVHDAEAANSRLSLEYAEDTAGSVSFSLEDYPDALRHYEHALDISRIAHENQAIQQISCADALWRLGRYDEAESTLEEIPHDVRQRADISLYIQVADASMRLSQDRYREAIEISTKALNSSPDIAAGQAAELRVARALAEGRLGQSTSAHLDADRLLKLGKDNSDEGIASQAELATAELFLWENHPEKAVPLLEAANQYFSRAGMKESEWKSLYLLAKVNKESGNKAGASQNAAKALDILRNLEQSWGSSAFAQYSSRPDNQIEMRELSHIV
jgi:tetratricopeptide (TPR) repeat protein